ncbi:MAG: alpha/beta hydrolase [Phycisphaeraceae bacterium]|nr:MAG: alpha/beta hydrolase [Phycisphaeraceae bacterium]
MKFSDGGKVSQLVGTRRLWVSGTRKKPGFRAFWGVLSMVSGVFAVPLLGCNASQSQENAPRGHAQTSPDQVDDMVKIWVVDASGMEHQGGFPVLYMATDRGGWDPAGLASVGEVSFQMDDPDLPQEAWTFLVPREWLEGEGVEAKFTRGDWSTVEVDGEGRDIANRRFTLGMVEPHTNIIGVDLMGFADQHRDVGGGRASTVVGTLETFQFHSEVLGRGRTIRVWLPRGYAEGSPRSPRFPRYPVMYMHDGQNLFDAATSFIGVEWGVDETLTELIAAGEVPAMIVVGIDNAGVYRASEYNPEGTEFGGVQNRGDLYLRFVLEELMPEIDRRYRTLQGPEHTGMGGSSFGGNATLYAAMRAPGVFGRILVESPASWIGDNALVKMARAHEGEWPARVFIAMGDNEYGEATRDAALVAIARELYEAVRAGRDEEAEVRLVIEPGAGHNEGAWAGRLGDAMRFLWGDGGSR